MSLRWYQREAVDAVWNYLQVKSGNPIVVAPTGSGKTHIVSQLTRDAVERWRGRVVILAHRKELLVQNANKLGMDAGLYSAGLNRRDMGHDVIVAGIQSVFRKAFDLGERNLIIIDEAHLVPHDSEGMYAKFLSDLRIANPKSRIVGLTATPYRLDSGPMCRPDGIFQKVAYSVDIPKLIADGYLCQLVSTPAESHVDSSQIRVSGGEFVVVAAQSEFRKLVGAACREIVAKTNGRHSVLVFCSGVQHAHDVADELERLTGERACTVTGETMPLERKAVLEQFKSGTLRWLCNCDVLTTGFDAPNIDAIAVLRATMSPGLFAQMVGRGFRVDEGKTDCLVLDFGENIKRHGPIDSPNYGIDLRSHQSEPGEAPVKVCPNCERENLIANRECNCGFKFPPPENDKEFDKSSDQSILAEPQFWSVESVHAQVWKKKGWQECDPRTVRISYDCLPADSDGGNLEREVINEWVCVEHVGFAGNRAAEWWAKRCKESMPMDAEIAVLAFEDGIVARPRAITTIKDGRWDRIIDYKLEEIPELKTADWDDDDIPF